MNLANLLEFVSTNGLTILTKIVVAVAIWFVGRWAIRVASRFVEAAVRRGGKIEPTLGRYLVTIIRAVLTAGLALGIIGYLGVETTSFAALLAGAGLAIGTAWGGLMQDFAAGVFLQLLRPFKITDYVVAGGVEGTVSEIGMFGTTLLTPDNVMTTVGNSKVFGGVIKNYSALPYRRVDAFAKIANGVEPEEAIAKLTRVIGAIPNVLATPAPEIDLLELTPEGPKLCVRPYCQPEHYWQVWFETNRAIVKTFGEAGYPVPETPIARRAIGNGEAARRETSVVERVSAMRDH